MPAPTQTATPTQALKWKLRDAFETWSLTHNAWLWQAVGKRPWLQRLVNRFLINSVVNRSATRPYPFSTMAAYTSWASLTDQTYNARALPQAPSVTTEPPAKQVAALFERGEEMIACPKSTVLFAYVAQWFTDGFLRSRRPVGQAQFREISRNESTHQVDLAQLYGLKAEVTAALRVQSGGLLKSISIGGEEYPPRLCGADGKPLDEFQALPPVIKFGDLPIARRTKLFAMGSDAANSQIGYTMLNVLFLREHNRIARALAEANPGWDDERLFATARNILTVVTIKVVIEEYINHIAPYRFEFTFDPASFWNAKWYRPNWVAVEFNLLYRWHSLIPSKLHIGGEELAIEDTLLNNDLLTDRGLGQAFQDASSQGAGKVCLLNTDSWFHARTTLPSIVQSREVTLRPYNEYRIAIQQAPATDFHDIAANPVVCERLRELYGSVDEVEFFVGLFAEEPRTNSVLAPLMGQMVAVHAFSQLMTNPLLARAVYNEQTFSPLGWKMIQAPVSFAGLLRCNIPDGSPEYLVTLTRKDWERV